MIDFSNSEIPNTSDTISRQDALDIFDDYNVSVENGELEAYSRDRKRLCELPSAERTGHWIPVSERLPEDMQYVLLTVRRLNNAYNPCPFISVGYVGWNQHHWWCAHDGDCEISNVEVLAWMPLPEPYKGGETE